MITTDDPRHGTPRGYRAGCKERCCLDAMARYERHRSKLKAMGHDGRLDPTGTKRRIRALQALGWTQKAIAAAGGFPSADSVHKVLSDSTSWVYATTAAKALRAYDALSMKCGPSAAVVAYAEQHGWRPPLAWDDETIDDPAVKPYGSTGTRDRQLVDQVLVQRALAGQQVHANPSERRLITDGWRAAGRPLNELDRIQGWNAHRDLRRAS